MIDLWFDILCIFFYLIFFLILVGYIYIFYSFFYFFSDPSISALNLSMSISSSSSTCNLSDLMIFYLYHFTIEIQPLQVCENDPSNVEVQTHSNSIRSNNVGIKMSIKFMSLLFSTRWRKSTINNSSLILLF